MHPSPRKKQKIRICLTLFTERMVFTPVYTMESWLPRAVCSPTLTWSERWFLSLNYWLHKHARRSDKQHFRWANDLPAIYLGGKYAVAAALSLQDSLVISKTIVQPLISLLSLQYTGTENRPDLRWLFGKTTSHRRSSTQHLQRWQINTVVITKPKQNLKMLHFHP